MFHHSMDNNHDATLKNRFLPICHLKQLFILVIVFIRNILNDNPQSLPVRSHSGPCTIAGDCLPFSAELNQ